MKASQKLTVVFVVIALHSSVQFLLPTPLYQKQLQHGKSHLTMSITPGEEIKESMSGWLSSMSPPSDKHKTRAARYAVSDARDVPTLIEDFWSVVCTVMSEYKDMGSPRMFRDLIMFVIPEATDMRDFQVMCQLSDYLEKCRSECNEFGQPIRHMTHHPGYEFGEKNKNTPYGAIAGRLSPYPALSLNVFYRNPGPDPSSTPEEQQGTLKPWEKEAPEDEEVIWEARRQELEKKFYSPAAVTRKPVTKEEYSNLMAQRSFGCIDDEQCSTEAAAAKAYIADLERSHTMSRTITESSAEAIYLATWNQIAELSKITLERSASGKEQGEIVTSSVLILPNFHTYSAEALHRFVNSVNTAMESLPMPCNTSLKAYHPEMIVPADGIPVNTPCSVITITTTPHHS
uniref:Uncharacterized protein n=1 Tax=Fibrocapsa japonica TaxID=94617 RepID=A0A7S2V419_9STRA|mmetsp:Transcript_3302/g.4839  ORF Transcript_3302/g.4839 Transcript_3302/m.4839 type:complete len:401 (+) Transcript_3302:62-1264(+)